MPFTFSQSRPLAATWRRIPNAREPSGMEDNLHNWTCLLHELRDDRKRRQFHATLTKSESISLLILEEWWHIDGNDAQGTERCKDWLENYQDDSGPFGDLQQNDQREYSKNILHLWICEFGTYDERSWAGWGIESPMMITITQALHRRRITATSLAAAHRLARQCYKALSTTTQRTEGRDLNTDWKPRDEVRQNFWTEMPIPASLNSCGWLKTLPGSPVNLPHYLWDIQDRRTILVADLDDCPKYTVLSHTWGRWKDGDKSIEVPNVPWPVPCNTLFDVAALPEALYRSSIPTRYLWLDLVCIPQSGCDSKLVEVGRSEIAKQAAIFAAAAHGMLWLNHITGWNGLHQAIHWLALTYLSQREKSIYDVDDMLLAAARRAEKDTQFASRIEARSPGDSWWTEDSGLPSAQTWEPSGWLTSLWTLQEICLRPHMYLCDQHLNIFQIAGRPIALDDVIALLNFAKLPASAPRTAAALYYTIQSSGMIGLLEMSRLSILNLGNTRYCKRRRAEAIMSAVGSTRWFESRTKMTGNANKENLVAGKYPLTFVEETRQGIGAAFFSSVNAGTPNARAYIHDYQDRMRHVRKAAMLMPFSSTQTPFRAFIAQDKATSLTYDHPSVNSWTILENGSVHLKQVGLIASWPARGSTALEPGVETHVIDVQPDYPLQRLVVDLNSWLGTFRPNAERYAVCLLQEGDATVHGVFLERIYDRQDDADDKPVRFFKLGNFYMFLPEDARGKIELPEITDVDWTVI